jgi:predicted phage tail protein
MLAISCPAEIPFAVEASRPGFQKHLLGANDRGVAYRVFVGEEQIDENRLTEDSKGKRIEIVPTPTGSGAVGRIIAGVLLLIIGIIFYFIPVLNILATPLITLGIGLIAGGVAAALAPNPKFNAGEDEEGFLFSGAINTVKLGVPIPLLLGEHLAGSSTISFGIRSTDGTFIAKDQVAKVLDLVSDGEIYGFVGDPLDTIYLNDQPLRQFDGTYADYRLGTNDQEPMPRFQATETTIPVGTELLQDDPQSRVTSAGKQFRILRINLQIAALSHSYDKGLGPLELSYLIKVTDSLGANRFVRRKFRKLVIARSSITEEVDLEGMTGPWTAEVTKTSKDTTGADQSIFMWDSYVEVGEDVLSYPNSAVVGLEFLASEHRGLPRRGFEMRGILCRVPSNYDPEAKTYTGDWDGTFQGTRKWTNNNAWLALELMTSDLFGMGDFIDDSKIDLWSLYRLAKRCDEVVDNLKGGTENRYTYNDHMQRGGNSWTVIKDMLASCHCRPYWTGAKISFVFDIEEDPVYEFNPTNVVNGLFTYASPPLASRHNRVLVRFRNPDRFYREDVVIAEDSASIAMHGLHQAEVKLTGCTSEGMASRHAYWMIESDKLGDSVRFRTGLEITPLMPGRVIRIQDPKKGVFKYGGRVEEGSSVSSISLDQEVELESGKSYSIDILQQETSIDLTAAENATSLTVDKRAALDDSRLVRVLEDIDEDGVYEIIREVSEFTWDEVTETGTITLTPLAGSTDPKPYRVEFPLGIHSANVTTASGLVSVIDMDTDLPESPPLEAVWVVYEQAETLPLYRVVTIENVGKLEYEVVALPEDPLKYARIDALVLPDSIDPTLLPSQIPGVGPPPPLGVVYEVELRRKETGVVPAIVVRWAPPDESQQGANMIIGYRVSWRMDDGQFQNSGLVKDTHFVIENAPFGVYEIRVSSEQTLTGRLSDAVIVLAHVLEDTLPEIALEISGLQVDGRVDNIWLDKHLTVSWKEKYTGSDELGEGLLVGAFEALLSTYVVTILDELTGDEIHVYDKDIRAPKFTYFWGDNVQDGGPRREVLVRVQARDIFGRESIGQEILVRNKAPDIPFLRDDITAVGPTIFMSLRRVRTDPDEAGILVWVSDSQGFDPADEGPVLKGNLDGLVTINTGAVAAGTKYVRYAAYDEFTEDPSLLNVSPEYEVEISGSELLEDSVDTEHIVDLAVTTAKIALLAVGNAQISALDAAKITTGSLSADRIAAGTIRANHLILGSADNLAQDPGFEAGDLGLFYVDDGGGGGFSVETSLQRTGGRAVRYDANGQSSNAYIFANSDTITAREGHVTASSGNRFYFEAWARYSGTAPAGNDVSAVIRFYNNAGAMIQEDVAASVDKVGMSSSYKRTFVTGIAPGGTVYAVFGVRIESGSPAGTDYILDDMYARRMVSTDIIEPGAITNRVTEILGESSWQYLNDYFESDYGSSPPETTYRDEPRVFNTWYTPIDSGVVNITMIGWLAATNYSSGSSDFPLEVDQGYFAINGEYPWGSDLTNGIDGKETAWNAGRYNSASWPPAVPPEHGYNLVNWTFSWEVGIPYQFEIGFDGNWSGTNWTGNRYAYRLQLIITEVIR